MKIFFLSQRLPQGVLISLQVHVGQGIYNIMDPTHLQKHEILALSAHLVLQHARNNRRQNFNLMCLS